MTAKKGAALGADPFKGIEALIPQDEPITPNAPNTQEVQYTPKTQGRKGQKLQRINMAFSPDNLDYLRLMASFEGVSITQYVNSLIDADQAAKSDLVTKICKLREENT